VGKNVAVFVDVANIFYAAKAAGVDIDYVTLLKSAIAGRDFVRAYAYTGLDPDNENQRNFHSFLSRHGYKVVSKDIRKYGDGKVKANLDIELVVDMLKTARNLDVAIVVSGDGDFAPAIRAVQEMGVRVEVISFRGNTSSDLIDVADQFTDIVQIAKVEKGSSRSGRRVADDGEDLSMTEVPDKLTEGSGRGRGRGTGRGRGRTEEAEREPVAASGRTRGRRAAAAEAGAAGAEAPAVGLVALPGEKLSKAGRARPAVAATAAAAGTLEGPAEGAEAGASQSEHEGEGPRRRRRRGGRGRGRGRGRGEGFEIEAGLGRGEGFEIEAGLGAERAEQELDEESEVVTPAPRAPRPGAFGSIWDSQTGQSRTPSTESTPFDLEEEEEPAIPEYLIAEQRRASGRGGPGRGRGGRGGGYSAAVERERYGRGGSGINRYPDVSGRGGPGRSGHEPRRDERASTAGRPVRERPAAGRSDEPWSEVPPELEAMLRAQLAKRTEERTGERAEEPTRPSGAAPSAALTTEAAPAAESESKTTKRTTTRRRAAAAAGDEGAATTAESAAPAASAPAETPSPRTRTTTRRKAATTTSSPVATATAEESPAPPKRRASSRTKAAASATASVGEGLEDGAAVTGAAPKRRTAARKKAATTEA
jgi:uncharacterized LabA/DUF88 family protein